jgi:hypothetical protein
MARTFASMSPRGSRRRASRNARLTHSDTGIPWRGMVEAVEVGAGFAVGVQWHA